MVTLIHDHEKAREGHWMSSSTVAHFMAFSSKFIVSAKLAGHCVPGIHLSLSPSARVTGI